MDILKYCFPVPKEDSKRVMTFANRDDFIHYRHHVYVKTGAKNVEVAEVGPRFEMRCRFPLLHAVPCRQKFALTITMCSVRDPAGHY